MNVTKKIISVLLVLQMGLVSSAPAFAQKSIDNLANTDNYFFEAADEISALEDGSNAKRVIVKFKDSKGKEKFTKTKNKKAKKGIKKNDVFETEDKSYAVVELEEDFSVDSFSDNILDVYGDSIDLIQEDYLISFFSDEEIVNSTGENETTDEIVNEETNKEIENNSQEVEENLQGEFVLDNVSNDTSTIVAVIDTGIDVSHQSFSNSIYLNQTETIDGVDDDGNGYADDICGWDFINNTDLSETQLDSNHGTHITGLIAENILDDTKILPLKVFENGTAYTSDIIRAIEYAEDIGAKVVNCSWGTTSENPVLKNAIQNSNMLFVCAAGNNASDISENPTYPASYDFDNVLSVGASNDRDYLAYFSNYGSNVDMAADGYKVKSTFANNSFGEMSGTSMSAAYVSGTAAAVYANSAHETKQAILNSCDMISTLTDKIFNGRRLNISNAISGVTVTDVTENKNIDYTQEHMDEVQKQYDGFELYDLDPETIQIAAGTNHSLTLSNWGDVYSYGDNTYKQLGSQYKGDTYFWIESVEGLQGIQDISTFGNHNLALDDYGKVYSWGENSRYQLGRTGNHSDIPMQVNFYANGSSPIVTDISAGGWFSLALDDDGTVWAWGDNTYGQLSQGSTGGISATPHIVFDLFFEDDGWGASLPDIKKVSAGKYHALVLQENGAVYGWGRNSTDHCISSNDTFSFPLATQIQGLPNNIIDIEAGDRCSFFLTEDGHVYAMGNNAKGQLGDGTTITRSVPTLLDIDNVKDIESNGSTLFMKTNGDVYACGANTSGQLGQGYANTRIETPVKVQGSDFDQIASGGSHNLMFKVNENYRFDEWYYRNATIYAMGDNSYNQCLAESSYNSLTSPTIVEEVENTEDTGEFLWSDNNLRPIDATYVSQNDDFLNFYNKDIRVNYTNTGAPANGYGEFAYLKFDVSNIQKEHIKSAKLNVYVKGGDTRQSTREIGVFDTYVSDWNGQTMTWNDGKPETRSLLGSFTVSANGHLIEEEDLGWHEIDVTDYLKNNCIDDKLSLALKMVSEQAHDIVIDSGVYNENFTFQDMHKNRNIPVLSIEYEAEEFYTQQRSTYLPVSDTYVSQYGSERNMNFANNEYLGVNYTPDESRTDYWGQDSYLAFNVDLTDSQREKIKSAKLWLYVDETSDTRDSTRTVNVSGNSGLNYNASGLTWASGRPTGEYELGSFNVQGNGFELVTPGWRQVDVTEFLTSSNNSELEFILKMSSNTQHPVKVRSREHLETSTRPRLDIRYENVETIFIGEKIVKMLNYDVDFNLLKFNIYNTGSYCFQLENSDEDVEQNVKKATIYNDMGEKICEFNNRINKIFNYDLSSGEYCIRIESESLNYINDYYELCINGLEFYNDIANSANEAKLIDVPYSSESSIDYQDDIDWYKFTSVDSMYYTVTGVTTSYINCSVYDEQLGLVENVDISEPDCYTLSFIAEKDKSYYIKIEAMNDDAIVEYSLNISQNSKQDGKSFLTAKYNYINYSILFNAHDEQSDNGYIYNYYYIIAPEDSAYKIETSSNKNIFICDENKKMILPKIEDYSNWDVAMPYANNRCFNLEKDKKYYIVGEETLNDNNLSCQIKKAVSADSIATASIINIGENIVTQSQEGSDIYRFNCEKTGIYKIAFYDNGFQDIIFDYTGSLKKYYYQGSSTVGSETKLEYIVDIKENENIYLQLKEKKSYLQKQNIEISLLSSVKEMESSNNIIKEGEYNGLCENKYIYKFIPRKSGLYTISLTGNGGTNAIIYKENILGNCIIKNSGTILDISNFTEYLEKNCEYYIILQNNEGKMNCSLRYNGTYAALNGYEDEFDSFTWNDSYMCDYNCYSYAMDTKYWVGLGGMPIGCLSERPTFMKDVNNIYNDNSYSYAEKMQLIKNEFIYTCNKDMEVLESSFKETSYNAVIDRNKRKVALVLSVGSSGIIDYHWFKLDKDMTWSHKPGWTMARNKDDIGNSIYIPTPETATMDNYNVFVGYFEVENIRDDLNSIETLTLLSLPFEESKQVCQFDYMEADFNNIIVGQTLKYEIINTIGYPNEYAGSGVISEIYKLNNNKKVLIQYDYNNIVSAVHILNLNE